MPRDQLSPEFTGAAADNPTWNSRQFYSVTRVGRRGQQVLGKNLACPPSISQLVQRGRPTIGVWTTASRQKVHIDAEDWLMPRPGSAPHGRVRGGRLL